MRKLIPFILILVCSCTKVHVQQQSLAKTFGADEINKKELAKVSILGSEVILGRGKPIKNPPPPPPPPPPPTDTVIVTPPPPPPVDTVVIPPVTLPSSIAFVMPPIVNQGSEGSCVAMALAYARSYEEYHRKGATSYDASINIFSPEYIFNQIKTTETCLSSALLTGVNFLRDNGVCTWASMPYTWMGCSLLPTAAQTAEAANFRIASYSTVYANDVIGIKSLLAAKRVLVCQVTVDQQFYNATSNFVWKSFTGALGAHAITVVGYDDSKHAFKIMNSWGTSWGDAGYSWIDYDFMKTVSSSLLVLNF